MENESKLEYKPKETEPHTKYNLLILDFHGTMTDHQLRAIRAYHHAGHEAFEAHLGKEFYQKALTRPSRNSGEPVTNKKFIEDEFLEVFGDQKVENFFERFNGYMNTTYIPIPNMPQVIKALLRNAVNVSILTNGSNREVIQQSLQKWGLGELSEKLYNFHITGVKKPNIRTVEHILEDYEKQGKTISPTETLMVGDYIDDIRTSADMGIDSVLLVRGNGRDPINIISPKPTYIITDPRDLLQIVKGEFKQELGDTFTPQPTLWPRENWNQMKE